MKLIKIGSTSRFGPLLKRIFLAGFFISVFVYWPWAQVPFEVPKVWFITRWIALLSVAGLIFGTFSLKKEKIDGILIILVLTFLSVGVISSIIGVDLAKSITGNYYRGDGLLTLVHLIILFFALALFADVFWIRGFIKVLAVSALILSLGSIILWILVYVGGIETILTWEGAFGSTFGNPNFLAGYLIITLPATYYFSVVARTQKLKRLLNILILYQIIAILVSRSRAGLMGIIIFLGGVVVLQQKVKIWIKVAVLGGFLLIFTVFLHYFYQSNLTNSGKNFVAESRGRIFMKGLIAARERPLLGFGWANFDYAFESSDWPFKLEMDVYVDKAHSALLEVLVTTGIIGLLVYILIIVRTSFNLFKMKSKFAKVALFVFLLTVIHMQTNVISISEEVVFWALIAFSAKEF